MGSSRQGERREDGVSDARSLPDLRRRRLLAALPALPIAGTARAQADPWASLRTPGHIALIRHAVAPGNFDPPGFTLGDCTTQRNLSEEGRQQARTIGGRFRANGIAMAAVYSSQWCRCLDTAALPGLGDVAPQPLLNSFAQDSGRGEPQMRALRAWLAALDLGRPTVLVTHQVVITDMSGVFPASGEIVVMQRDPAGAFTLRGRIAT